MTNKPRKKARYGLFSTKSIDRASKRTEGPFSHFGEFSFLGEDVISSAWVLIKPNAQIMLNAIICDDQKRAKRSLINGAESREFPVIELDSVAGFSAESTAFFRGWVVVDEVSHTATRSLPSWHQGEALYLLNNLSPIIHSSRDLQEMLRALYAARLAQVASAEEQIDAVDLGQLSLCALMGREDWELLSSAHNHAKFPFHLVRRVEMEF